MKCGVHQDREAIGTCTECGIGLCEDCRVVIKEKNVCKKCVEKVINQPRKASVALAIILSIIFPGAGQLYNGQIGKAFLFLLTSWLIIPWFWGIYDAYAVATKINEGKLANKPATGCLIALAISFFVLIPGCALLSAIAIPNLLRAKMNANDALAKATVNAVATAAESYAAANQNHFPTSIKDLTDANPPYLSKDYCSETISGYSYVCEFSASGYQITATPVTIGATGSTTLSAHRSNSQS